MRLWRPVWLFGSATLALLGCAGAVLVASIGPTLVIFCGITAGVVSVSVTFYFSSATTPPTATPAREGVVVVVRHAVLCGVAAVSLYGYARLVGASALLLALLVAAGSPPAVEFYRRRLTGTASAPAPDLAADKAAGQGLDVDLDDLQADVEVREIAIPPEREPGRSGDGDAGLPLVAAGLSDLELCWAWRRSFVALAEALSPSERARVVQARQSYLDELERRYPEGFASWLESGARAAGDPSKFVADDNDEPPSR